MNAQLTSWLRTVVPGLWAGLVAWLVSLGLPDTVTTAVAGAGEAVVFPVVLAAVYALLRRAERHLPDWLTRVFLGSAKVPTYGTFTQRPGTVTVDLTRPPGGPSDALLDSLRDGIRRRNGPAD
ncbi:hypothetical protein NQK81_13245 [Amycolatopsis roodepoortensis]|uniref:hypothetical protein n=1 Tax=Amycolatopsis roodepoortensis TaxID=700274 RepID=UPI00214C853F|nr:hypothetical protein [Amycolatopsis roodepoortensis]UUV34370.1 hypothetical protein NQK81_13245 [Amycolatopsis roodepoortensis]